MLAAVTTAAGTPPAQGANPATDRLLQWASGRSAADPGALSTGLNLARERAAAMRDLLRSNPEEFVRQAMPETQRARLPADVQDLVERRVKARAEFVVYCVLPTGQEAADSHREGGFRRDVILGGKSYRAHVFGPWRDQTSIRETDLEGVVLGDEIALGDAPTPQSSGSSGGTITPQNATLTGMNTLLYMIARFSDQTSDPVSGATALSQMTVVSNFWRNNSYGQVAIQGRVNTNQPMDIVYITLPQPSWYATNYNANFSQLISDSRTAAQAQGFNYTDYNLDVVVTTGSGFGYAGRASVGGQGAHLVSGYTSQRTAAHELGHNLGLWHANFWRTDSPLPFGRDLVPGGYVADTSNAEWVEYGHYCSIMSAQSGTEMDDATKPHYAAAEKVKLGWLSGARVQYVSASGTYRVYRHDHISATNNPRAVRIETTATDYTGNARRYWLNYRYAPWSTAQNWLRNGLQIDVARTTYGSDGAIMLDPTPFSSDTATPFFDPANRPSGYWTIDNSDKKDGALTLGRTFSDATAGIHITPVATGNSGLNQEYVDFVVNLGTFPGNAPPLITSFTASTNQVNSGQNVDFSVTAVDPNGDPLAYSWDYDQVQVWTPSGLNTNTATKNWPAAGQYRVTVTVSDMKGGVATDSILITVGSPASNRQIFGRVLASGKPVAGARIFSSTSQCFSETDGSYLLNDLPASSISITCRADGLTFSNQFSNPISLASTNAYGKDFYATQVTSGPGYLAVVPYEAQVNAGASLALRAHAWNTSGTLSAVTPIWSTEGGTIDSNGVFTAEFPGGPYRVIATSGSLSATGQVWATGTYTPLVSVESPIYLASESGGAATFRLTRTGPTSGDLNVSFNISGTANYPNDYSVTGPWIFSGSNGAVTIPAGQSFADIVVTALDDAIVEADETLSLVLVDAAAYNPGVTNSALVTLIDNDVQSLVVSPEALFAVEGGSASFQVRLALQPSEAVTVLTARESGAPQLSVSSGSSLVFGPANWDIPQNVTVSAAEDDDILPDSAVFTVSASGASNRTVTLEVADNDTVELVLSTNTVEFNEGATNGFALRLTAQPTNDVAVSVVFESGDADIQLLQGGSLLFTPANWNLPQNILLSALPDPDALPDSASFQVSSPGLTPLAVLALVTDDDRLEIALSTNRLMLVEGGTNQLTVQLGAQPTNDLTVTVTFAAPNPDLSLLEGASLTFTTTNWNVPQLVRITAASDPDAEPESASLTLAAPGLSIAVAAIEVADLDVLAIALSTNELALVEGGTNQLAIWLTAQPTNDLTITAAFEGLHPHLSLPDGSTLIFTPTNWNAPQTLRVAAIHDPDAEPESASLIVSAPGLSNALAAVEVADLDVLAIALSTNSLALVEGGTNEITVQLTAQPTNNITVTAAFGSGDPDLLVVEGDSLLFTPTNWNVPLVVRVAAAHDDDIVPDSATLLVSSAGLGQHPVAVSAADDDIVALMLSTQLVELTEGGTNGFTVRLTAQPTNDLTVTTSFDTGDADISVIEGASLVFTPTNWNLLQTVRITAASDPDDAPDLATLLVSSPGLDSKVVPVYAADDDVLALVLATNSLVLAQGETNSFTVQLNRQPTNDVTVTTAFDSGDADLSVDAGAVLLFTPTNWDVPQAVWIVAAADADTTNDLALFRVSAPGLSDAFLSVLGIDPDTNPPVQLAISALVAEAAEFGATTGRVAIIAATAPGADLSINLLVTGTASNGVDFVALTNTAFLAAASSQADLEIVPLADALPEGNEIVSITLLPGSGYALGDQTNAVVTLHDKPFDAWRFDRFTSDDLLNGAIAGPDADPDHDGFCNLLEYAFVLDPHQPDSAGAPSGGLDGNYFVLTYRQNRAAIDLSYVPEARDLLESGSWSTNNLVEWQRTDRGAFDEVRVRDTLGVTNAPSRFLRLNTSLR